MTTRPANRRMLLVLAAVFLLPVAAAFALYYGGSWRPGGFTNHGNLFDPARPLPQILLQRVFSSESALDPLRGKWSLVYVGEGICDADCHHALLVMRQTRLLLNSEMDRVGRVFLATLPCCDQDFLDAEHKGIDYFHVGVPAAEPLLAQFPAERRAQSLFVVDPLGNLVMSFDTREDPKGLLEDLKKLLKLSHIG
jgi:hypothetical protein